MKRLKEEWSVDTISTPYRQATSFLLSLLVCMILNELAPHPQVQLAGNHLTGIPPRSQVYGISYTIMSQIRSCSSPTASYPVSICVASGSDDFFPLWEFLADVFTSGFAFIDWFATCLSSVTRAFCLSFFQEFSGITMETDNEEMSIRIREQEQDTQ
ncbi:hypothetical protein RhiirC2_717127 [Rhizophagus irregularis]|uniref:Uncharacterized protein n=1 Tax=Rhizophagus irregularis TaxID=588596 RepID=A0A2N1MNN5_9GLOM|nr:hypothetical protein RhiirC2_717127 [Rhizophagus irregularis]